MSTPTLSDLDDVTESALAQPTFCAAFQMTAAAYGDRPALSTADGSLTVSWTQYAARVRALAGGLTALGVGSGDTVGLMLTNRPEFHVVDTAAIHIGATPFSIYNTNPPEQIVPLLVNSGARVVVTEPVFLDRIVAAQRLHPALEHIVVVGGPADGPGQMTFEALEALEAPDLDFERAWQSLTPDSVVTLVYTSGTTGEPKGVQHTHRSLLSGMRTLHTWTNVSPEGRVVSFLPMAHIAERFISHYSAMVFGLAATSVADPKQLPATIVATRPTRLFGVPRIYEKLHAGVRSMIAQDHDGPLATALDAGLARVRAEQAGEQVPDADPAHEPVLAAVREKLGLDQLEWCGVAAAPSPRPVLEFFPAIGVNLMEFWGMSECILSTCNPVGAVKIGTIGPAAPGVEIDLADDGEILVRGPNVMCGYRGEPAKTAEAIDAAGWLHTGDIAVRDDDGYLTIVDRKKELIINSAGKNMAPTKIEMAVKAGSSLIAQVVAIGDGLPYVTGLVVLDPEAAERHGAWDGDFEAFTSHADVVADIDAAVAAGNEKLARVEQLKTFTIIGQPWAPGGDELTPTLKLRRKPITEKYAAQIDAMYG
jgi:long-subunit acyl-CoA synthetase (AMP-forming)